MSKSERSQHNTVFFHHLFEKNHKSNRFGAADFQFQIYFSFFLLAIPQTSEIESDSIRGDLCDQPTHPLNPDRERQRTRSPQAQGETQKSPISIRTQDGWLVATREYHTSQFEKCFRSILANWSTNLLACYVAYHYGRIIDKYTIFQEF